MKMKILILPAHIFLAKEILIKRKSAFGQIVNPLGAGVFQNYARNKLNIEVWNISHKGSLDKGKHFIQWGVGVDHTIINDKLNEWEFQDSAGYSLPFNPNVITLSKVIKSKADAYDR